MFQKKDLILLQKDGNIIENATSFVHETLTELKVDKRHRVRTELLCEETITQLTEHAEAGASLHVRVINSPAKVSILLDMRGDEFDMSSDASLEGLDPGDASSLDAIRAIILKAYGENFKYSHARNENRVRILIEKPTSMLFYTLFAMALGLLFGVLSGYVFPAQVTDVVSHYALVPVRTIFMNALKMIIAPVVFLSILTSFSQYGSLSEFGKLGAKVMAMYFSTSVIAVLLGIGLSQVIRPGAPGFALGGDVAAYEPGNIMAEASLLNTIVGIVPSNFVSPFLESNTLQLIFLAVICGIALGMIGNYARVLREIFEALNSLFLTVTTLITGFIPVVVFCSVSLLVINLKLSDMGAILGICGLQLLAVICMLCIYGLMILFIGRLNPLVFYRNIREGMLTSFSLSSSSAAMTTNLRICREKLGISPRVCNFSIPLGATVNMDGTCLYLTVFGLFLARAYDVSVDQTQLVSLAVTVILLSLGAPGVPGAGLLCTAVVLNAIGVPVEAIGLIIAVNPIIDMLDTMNNTTGDMAVSLVAAKSEGMLDRDVYYEK